MAIPTGYEHRNVVLPSEVWEEVFRLASVLSISRGTRVPMYEALTLIIKLGLKELDKQRQKAESS